ncbi:MAG: hypothetical protein DRJ20_01305 [Candidatus Methanomethylicota archaeon]|uniref:Uncharacterized protein n=1 Tax=Thermoproteota archaeon TaxID=2056631 RepID=A0A497EXG4_9CREN|nr:MAG: hypothetical protein DRJ20_01305 [Candidatus Verstraetearchaeota archaeon]
MEELKSRVKCRLEEAVNLLKTIGYECNVTPEDFIVYMEAETPYPDLGLEEILENIILVAHELVEINEIKKMNLPLTRRVIMDNLEEIYEIHVVKALPIELQLAEKLSDYNYIKWRLRTIEVMLSEDELLPEKLKPKLIELHKQYSEKLKFKRD